MFPVVITHLSGIAHALEVTIFQWLLLLSWAKTGIQTFRDES